MSLERDIRELVKNLADKTSELMQQECSRDRKSAIEETLRNAEVPISTGHNSFYNLVLGELTRRSASTRMRRRLAGLSPEETAELFDTTPLNQHQRVEGKVRETRPSDHGRSQ